ncbi:MAG: murein biosynthesis integral membrane protein MurJ [Candidatus Berkelbacteria bacterium]|nr:murein biosynthesis integral membrane protein MurJ [Candidatus Berkelbacteria bacterium]
MFDFIRRKFTARNSVALASVYLAFFALLSRILGIFRDRLFAARFGAGNELDAYFAAFRIPDFIFNLLIIGALSAAFIPVFTRYLTRNHEDEAFKISNSVTNLVVLLWIVVALIIFIFARPILGLLVPGFNAEKLGLTVSLTRIMLLSPLFFGISAVAGSMLNSFRRFFSFALAPVLYNLGIIAGAIFLTPKFGVYGLAMGVVFGAFLHMLLQQINAYMLGYRYQRILDLKHPGVRRIIKLALPRILGMAVDQIDLFVQTLIGSLLIVGTVAAFNFANNLASLPVGLFGVALATAVFPTLAEKAGLRRDSDFVYEFSRVARVILFLTIPTSAMIILLRAQIVRLVLGTGNFSWHDTRLTFGILGFLAISIFAFALIPLLARAFYAFEDTRTPVYIGITSVVIDIILALTFVGKINIGIDLGPQGLALAYSISTIIQMLLLFIFLQRKLKIIDFKSIFLSILKFGIATLFMIPAVQWSKFAISPFIRTDTGVGILIQALVAILVGIISYSIVAFILRCDEFRLVVRYLPFIGKRLYSVEYDRRSEK